MGSISLTDVMVYSIYLAVVKPLKLGNPELLEWIQVIFDIEEPYVVRKFFKVTELDLRLRFPIILGLGAGWRNTLFERKPQKSMNIRWNWETSSPLLSVRKLRLTKAEEFAQDQS